MFCSSKFGMKRTHRAILAACSTALAVGMCSAASADVVTLQDGNAVATVDEATGNVLSLTVGGVSQVANQSLFYSTNGGAPQYFSTLTDTYNAESYPSSTAANPDGLFLNYSGPNFTAQVSYILAGGASPTQSAQLDLSVLLLGNSEEGSFFQPGATVSVSVYQYDHLVLDDNTNNTAIANSGGIFQSEIGGRGTTANVTPQGDEYQVGLTPSIFNSLTNPASLPVTLNSSMAGPVTGNVEFAIETDQPDLTALSQLFVNTTETFNPGVPVPPAAWMGLTTLLGIGGIAAVRRRLAKA